MNIKRESLLKTKNWLKKINLIRIIKVKMSGLQLKRCQIGKKKMTTNSL